MTVLRYEYTIGGLSLIPCAYDRPLWLVVTLVICYFAQLLSTILLFGFALVLSLLILEFAQDRTQIVEWFAMCVVPFIVQIQISHDHSQSHC